MAGRTFQYYFRKGVEYFFQRAMCICMKEYTYLYKTSFVFNTITYVYMPVRTSMPKFKYKKVYEICKTLWGAFMHKTMPRPMVWSYIISSKYASLHTSTNRTHVGGPHPQWPVVATCCQGIYEMLLHTGSIFLHLLCLCSLIYSYHP